MYPVHQERDIIYMKYNVRCNIFVVPSNIYYLNSKNALKYNVIYKGKLHDCSG